MEGNRSSNFYNVGDNGSFPFIPQLSYTCEDDEEEED